MSATSNSPPLGASAKREEFPKDSEKHAGDTQLRDTSLDYGKGEDILGQQDIDPALNAKMHIVNNVKAHFYSFKNVVLIMTRTNSSFNRPLIALDGQTITGNCLS
jgi:hypothetical protein